MSKNCLLSVSNLFVSICSFVNAFTTFCPSRLSHGRLISNCFMFSGMAHQHFKIQMHAHCNHDRNNQENNQRQKHIDPHQDDKCDLMSLTPA